MGWPDERGSVGPRSENHVKTELTISQIKKTKNLKRNLCRSLWQWVLAADQDHAHKHQWARFGALNQETLKLEKHLD